MPKAGPSPLEWKRRLEAFARGEYVFSTGQKPRKGSRWHRDLCAIEACPTHGKPVSARDPYGRPLVCKCGYHKISAKVSKICRFIFVLQSTLQIADTLVRQPLSFI